MSVAGTVKTTWVVLAFGLFASRPAHAADVPASGSEQRAPALDGDALRPRAVALATTAFGMPGVDFVNQLVGARIELEYTPRFALGFTTSYANLKGKDGRAHNVLMEAALAYRAPLGAGTVGVPLRLSGGYLPKNGPTLRFGAGLELALDEALAVELALVEPMVWSARERPELSLNLGAGASVRF